MIVTHHMKRQSTVITHLSDITPEWLTDVVGRSYPDAETRVTECHVLLEKSLPYSTVARLGIGYAKKTLSAPKSLFIKLCPGTIGDSSSDGVGEKEVEFYSRVAPTFSCPPLVRSYDAAFSSATGRSHILMEDLSETHS